MERTSTAIVLLATLAFLHTTNLMADEAKTRNVKIGEMELKVPTAWKQEEPSSRLRLAQFRLAAEEGEEVAELAVFSFGASGIDDNIRRWIGQFSEKERTVKLTTGDSKLGKYFWCEIHGTYNKPDGPPFAMKTVLVANSRVINVALIGVDKQLYFFKLTGLDKTAAAHADALRMSFGGDAKNEKDYKTE